MHLHNPSEEQIFSLRSFISGLAAYDGLDACVNSDASQPTGGIIERTSSPSNPCTVSSYSEEVNRLAFLGAGALLNFCI
jgi:hypothetical protein